LKLLTWPEGASKQQALEEAVLCCPSCGGVIENSQKQRLNESGRYVPHVLDETGEHIRVDDIPKNSNASFWVTGMASPWQSFGQIAEKLVEAYKSHEIERIQAVVNTYGGEIFRMKGDAPDWKDVQRLAQDYKPQQAPDDVQMIVSGVDVQKYGLYYTVRGFGFNSESWLLAHGFITGETEFDNVWLLLNRVLEQEYGGGRTIERMFVDSGYRADQVYAFCRRNQGRAFPTKGHDTQDRPIKMSNIDVTVGGKVHKGGAKLWHLDTDHMKSWVYSRIRWPEGESGGWHIYNGIDEDYCKQVVSEELVIKASGRRVWVQRQKDNHYLDCETNAYAAALSLQVQTLKPIEQKEKPQNVKPKNSQSSGAFIKRPSGSFIR
jgi:phage terminase large subunit GpA-like protein